MEGTRSIQKKDNFGGSNIDNAICLPSTAIWHSLRTRSKLSSVYSLSAIRRISGFMTVSDEAILVLPREFIDTLMDKMRGLYLRRLEYPGQIATIKAEERWTSLLK